ncbi:hypothetical protein KUCAC02_025682 [Scomber scombrus]|uniref:Uncharacterized protein n=1 Tax=Scomber scombrus TaxID=13677 RepID=A0AAV1PHF2_SCOSC
MAYLTNEDPNLAEHSQDKQRLARFAYLLDIFNKHNTLSKCLQEKENSILELEDGIQRFIAHQGMWQSQLGAGKLAIAESRSELEVLVTLQVNNGSKIVFETNTVLDCSSPAGRES